MKTHTGVGQGSAKKATQSLNSWVDFSREGSLCAACCKQNYLKTGDGQRGSSGEDHAGAGCAFCIFAGGPVRQALLRVFRPHRDDVEDRPGLCCVGRGGGACRRWLQLSGLEDGARAWSPNLHSCSGGNAEVQTGRGVPGSVRGGPLPFFVDEEDTPRPMRVGMQEGRMEGS